MKFVSKILLMFFILGLIPVCLPQKVLAVLSDEGITSFQIYQPKANQGDADAQFNFALLYYHGAEVPQDLKQAVYWYTKAAEQGLYFAKVHRTEMLEKMSQNQNKEVQKLSKELYEKIENKAN